jgi:transcriptional regulator of acetoin/glycerol metabolism
MSIPFDRHQCFLWPALLLLTRGRERQSPRSVLERIFRYFKAQRFGTEKLVQLSSLKTPCSEQDVIEWLHTAWRIFELASLTEIARRRREILNEIVASGLSSEEQTDLITALDYMARLCSARKFSRIIGGSPSTVPPSHCQAMQVAYLKLAGLAAADLPIWLAGEKGCEVEVLARLAHSLRGLPETAFFVEHFDGDREPAALGKAIERLSSENSEATVFIKDADEIPVEIQKALHKRLVADVVKVSSLGVIVGTASWNLASSAPKDILHELFAFLSPFRIDIPPLRMRTADIPELVRFLAVSSSNDDVEDRFTPEAMKILREYHWPGNVEELRLVSRYVVNRRPSGAIRVEDLPDTVKSSVLPDETVSDRLTAVLKESEFRALRTEEGRQRMALFLTDSADASFSSADVQRLFRMGRETVRRLLQSLQAAGVIEGLRGAKNQRITRYRVLSLKK